MKEDCVNVYPRTDRYLIHCFDTLCSDGNKELSKLSLISNDQQALWILVLHRFFKTHENLHRFLVAPYDECFVPGLTVVLQKP